jgi:hypothetical protein
MVVDVKRQSLGDCSTGLYGTQLKNYRVLSSTQKHETSIGNHTVQIKSQTTYTKSAVSNIHVVVSPGLSKMPIFVMDEEIRDCRLAIMPAIPQFAM